MKSFAFVLLLFSMGCTAFAPAPEFTGAAYNAPAPPPDFSFPATTGDSFTLSDQVGRVTLLFFGYTFCPDVCPQTLGTVRAALNRMDPALRENVQLVFISVDPERDSLGIIDGYLARFDSDFIGVRPESADLEQLEADYAMVAQAEAPEGEDGGYLVSHTSLVYVLDKEGDLRLGFFSGMSAEDMAHDLTILAAE